MNTYATWWRRRWRDEVSFVEPPDAGESNAGTDEVDVRVVVTQALSKLTRGQRAVVVLRHLHDMSEAETAQVLGCSVGTVKSQHARAMAQLRTSQALAG